MDCCLIWFSYMCVKTTKSNVFSKNAYRQCVRDDYMQTSCSQCFPYENSRKIDRARLSTRAVAIDLARFGTYLCGVFVWFYFSTVQGVNSVQYGIPCVQLHNHYDSLVDLFQFSSIIRPYHSCNKSLRAILYLI